MCLRAPHARPHLPLLSLCVLPLLCLWMLPMLSLWVLKLVQTMPAKAS